MSWFRVDDKSAFHRKVVRAGNAAWGALCRMGAYSADHGDDGFVCLEVASMIASESELAMLMSVGLLERTDRDGGGYMIHDFLEWNPSRESLESLSKKRAKAGRRGGSKRKANALASVQAIASPIAEAKPEQRDGLGVGSLSSQGERERESGTIRVVRNATDDGANGMSVGMWCEGIRSVTGKTYPMPTHGLQTMLVGCFVAQNWGGEIGESARAAGAAYAIAHAGRTLSPHGYVAWEGSGRPSVGPAKAPLQPVPPGGRAWKVGK